MMIIDNLDKFAPAHPSNKILKDEAKGPVLVVLDIFFAENSSRPKK